MGRIRDLTTYVGSLLRGDIWFPMDGNSFAKGQKISGQQVYELCKGADGKNVMIRSTGTWLQWQLEGDPAWTNLVALSTLRGDSGKELEIRTSGGFIQTRLTGGTWGDLIAISELKGNPADNPNLQFEITALTAGASATASISGTYPNLTVHLGIPRGENAAAPEFGFQISALEWDDQPTAQVSGTYPNLTVSLGLPRGKDADSPAFTISAESLPAGTAPSVEKTGTYPNLGLVFKIPQGAPGVEGKGPVVMANGNYGNWDAGLQQYVDSGVPAVAGLSEAAVAFTTAEVRANIASNEQMKVLFGKIRKWFIDFGPHVFKPKVDWDTDVDNRPPIPDPIKVINLTGGSATVDYGIEPYVDYAFTVDVLVNNISVTDLTGIAKTSTLSVYDITQGGYKKTEVDSTFAKKTDVPDSYTKTVSDSRYVAKEAGKGLIASTDQAKLDIMGSDTQSSLSGNDGTGMTLTKHNTAVTAGTSQTLGIKSVSVSDMDYMIVFTASAAIPVAIPNSGIYINMSETAYSLASGGMLEIHVFKSSAHNGNYLIRVAD